ncbi:MAG TPA: hypothetical protein VIY52_29035 [Streptosporangiaceae bacterium]
MQVLAGVVQVDDLGGFGELAVGDVPDPGGAVARDRELADVIGAAPVPSIMAYSLSGTGDGGSDTSFRAVMSAARSRTAAACVAPLASAARSTRLAVSRTPARSSSSPAASANGPAAAALSFIAARPGDRDAPATPSSQSRGAKPCPQAWQ